MMREGGEKHLKKNIEPNLGKFIEGDEIKTTFNLLLNLNEGDEKKNKQKNSWINVFYVIK